MDFLDIHLDHLESPSKLCHTVKNCTSSCPEFVLCIFCNSDIHILNRLKERWAGRLKTGTYQRDSERWWTEILWWKFKNQRCLGLPWWRSGWESACQCKGHGFEPWSGKIPHAAEQLGPWATTTEPACLEPVLRNKRSRDSERPAHRDEEWPPLAAARESPRTETKTQHSQK